MMKKQILLLAVLFLSGMALVQAQIRVVDDFGNLKLTQGGTEPWRVQGSSTGATLNTHNIYQEGNVGVGFTSTDAATEKLDVKGNARVRTLADGSVQTDGNYTRTVVAKADGTLGYTDGEVRRTRIASNNTQATFSSTDEVLVIGSSNVTTVTLPANPPVGKVVTIISLGDGDHGISPSYIPNKIGAVTSNVATYSAADYKANMKRRTILKLIFVQANFAGGSGWIQLDGDNQN